MTWRDVADRGVTRLFPREVLALAGVAALLYFPGLDISPPYLASDESFFAATAHSLEPNPPHWTYRIAEARVQSADALQRHKTDWRDLYERESGGGDEIFFLNEQGHLAEGARSNIFVARGDVLLTPPLTAGALNGRLRAELLKQGLAREADLTVEQLAYEATRLLDAASLLHRLSKSE